MNKYQYFNDIYNDKKDQVPYKNVLTFKIFTNTILSN